MAGRGAETIVNKKRLCSLVLCVLCSGAWLCGCGADRGREEARAALTEEQIEKALGGWTARVGDRLCYVGIFSIDPEEGTVEYETTITDRGKKTVPNPSGTEEYRLNGPCELVWNPRSPITLTWDPGSEQWQLRWMDLSLQRLVPELVFGAPDVGPGEPPA